MPGEITSTPDPGIMLTDARVQGDLLVAYLADGRIIATPIAWYPRLLRATAEQREKFEISGFGLHWPELDEDLSVQGMLRGNRAPQVKRRPLHDDRLLELVRGKLEHRARLVLRDWARSEVPFADRLTFPQHEIAALCAEIFERMPEAARDPNVDRGALVAAIWDEAKIEWTKVHPNGPPPK